MDIRDVLDPMFKTDLDELFNKKYLAIHEGTFMLTEWPKDSYRSFIQCTRSVKELKTWCKFFLPRSSSKFDPSQYGSKFEHIFSLIKADAERGILDATPTYLCDGITWVMDANHLVFWALKKGVFIPEDLQNKLGIYLFDNKLGKASENLVKKKIIAQTLLCENPRGLTNRLKKDFLFSNFGINSVDENYTVIGKAIESVRNKPGNKGIKKRDPYVAAPISEIIRIDPDGKVRFNLPSLQVALKTLLWIWVYRFGQNQEPTLPNGISLMSPVASIPEAITDSSLSETLGIADVYSAAKRKQSKIEASYLVCDGMINCYEKYKSPISDWYRTNTTAQLYLSDAPPLLLDLALEYCSDVWRGIEQHWEYIEDNGYIFAEEWAKLQNSK